MLSSEAQTEQVIKLPEPKVKITGSKDSLNEWLWDKTQGVVQSGPFRGMQLIKEQSWHDDNLGTKCLGCYEQELHHIFEHEIERLAKIEAPLITDIGCAEGYYAVGLSMRLPKAKVAIIDSDPKAGELCVEAAKLNGVDGQLLLNSTLDSVLNASDLVICDCEGAEVVYLDIERFPGLKKTVVVVETHDWPGNRASEILCERFKETHEVLYCLSEGSRSPNEIDLLRPLPSHAKWMAISEGRPATQYFLYLIPK